MIQQNYTDKMSYMQRYNRTTLTKCPICNATTKACSTLVCPGRGEGVDVEPQVSQQDPEQPPHQGSGLRPPQQQSLLLEAQEHTRHCG